MTTYELEIVLKGGDMGGFKLTSTVESEKNPLTILRHMVQSIAIADDTRPTMWMDGVGMIEKYDPKRYRLMHTDTPPKPPPPPPNSGAIEEGRTWRRNR